MPSNKSSSADNQQERSKVKKIVKILLLGIFAYTIPSLVSNFIVNLLFTRTDDLAVLVKILIMLVFLIPTGLLAIKIHTES